ncbi:hypothetical protein MLD38_023190 [Melastoma candidum]|uniref:Uncharacterized protein n=1 Tax=Melastoma candidum TaxID=119954 RepID=A0ACB9QLL9_9MYRT|nr:hypothetical protein MLD38_023190 [Melastoma candidum]
MSGGGGREEELNQIAELSKNLKEGERLLAPTRRPDGTLRKPVRIRAGYVPQEEVAIYQSKGALWRKEMAASQEVPPGYYPVPEGKPKTKSAKRNERKKEKRLQAALEKDTNSDAPAAGERIKTVGNSDNGRESVASMTAQLDNLTVSANGPFSSPPSVVTEDANPASSGQDIDKRIRALKKKIRLAEGQQQKNGEKDLSREQQDKLTKLEGWRRELNILEDSKAKSSAS